MALDKFIRSEGRPLPVFLLVDVSGSMFGTKIDTVNVALKEMINQFSSIENAKGSIELCIITFNNSTANIIKPLSAVSQNDSYVLEADGMTPLGKALDLVTQMVEDYQIVSSRSYTPTIVLISDGNPTDYDADGKSVDEILSWDKMSQVHSNPRISKAIKLAMGIGDDLNINVMKAFVNNPEIPVIHANDVGTITKFFNWVTMTVSIRSVSANPNVAIVADPEEVFDDDEMEL